MITPESENKMLREDNRFEFHNHIEYVSITPTGCIAKVELQPESKNMFGTAHGALIFALIDCAAGETTRAYRIGPHVTLSSSVNFFRNVDHGTIYAKSELVKRGKQVSVLHVTVYDENELLLADASLTMMKATPPTLKS